MQDESFTWMRPTYPNDGRYESVTFKDREYKIPVDRPVRIYCDGIFDLFHHGHIRLFEQVKGLFPNVTLVVGVCDDETTKINKGSFIMHENERVESVKSCKYVDEIIEHVPWFTGPDFLEKHNIDYVAHDEAPYPGIGTDDVYGLLKEINRFIPTKRAASISTTSIITRIVKNYDAIIKRQILRGISCKDLNISYFKRGRIMFKETIKKDVCKFKKDFRYAFQFWDSFTKSVLNSLKVKINLNRLNMVARITEMIKVGTERKFEE